MTCSRAANRRPLAERFWEKVNKTDSCWLWTGAVNPSGYGILSGGPDHLSPMLAHRVAWSLTFDDCPDSLHVCHHCDIRICCRPDHLFLGTDADNMHDAAVKGRLRHGHEHYMARLTEDDVRSIRARYKPGVVTRIMLANEYGVAPTTIGDIVSRRTWKHVV